MKQENEIDVKTDLDTETPSIEVEYVENADTSFEEEREKPSSSSETGKGMRRGRGYGRGRGRGRNRGSGRGRGPGATSKGRTVEKLDKLTSSSIIQYDSLRKLTIPIVPLDIGFISKLETAEKSKEPVDESSDVPLDNVVDDDDDDDFQDTADKGSPRRRKAKVQKRRFTKNVAVNRKDVGATAAALEDVSATSVEKEAIHNAVDSRAQTDSASSKGSVLCPICGKGYASEQLLSKHTYDIHGNFECGVCHVKISRYAAFLRHRDMVHNDGKGNKRCPQCTQTFYTKRGLDHHVFKCHRVKERFTPSLPCPVCQRLLTPKLLHLHAQETHPEETYCCPTCPKIYLHDCFLVAHLRKRHPELPLKSCRVCQEPMFATERAVDFHMDECHEDADLDVEKPFLCLLDHCQRRFRRESFLQQHSIKHRKRKFETGGTVVDDGTEKKVRIIVLNGAKKGKEDGGMTPSGGDDGDWSKEGLRQCASCGQMVPRSKWQNHMRLHKPSPRRTCEECGKVYCSKSMVKRHRLAKHQNVKFPCPVDSCGQQLSCQSALLNHVKMKHSPKTRFQCAQCDKSFATRQCLELHIRGDHEGLKVQCRSCDKEFNRPSDRNRHERKVHGSATEHFSA